MTKNRPSIYKITANRLPDFWKEQLNKERIKGETSKLAKTASEEKKREVMGEWIKNEKIAKGHI